MISISVPCFLLIEVQQGAASFVKKTIFGVSDSVTKFTSSVGKGMDILRRWMLGFSLIPHVRYA